MNWSGSRLRGPDIGVAMFEGQADRTSHRAGPVQRSARHSEHLPRLQRAAHAFEIDQQLPFKDEEGLVAVRVSMPMEVAFQHACAHHVIVDLRQNEVSPVVAYFARRGMNVNDRWNLSHEFASGHAQADERRLAPHDHNKRQRPNSNEYHSQRM